MKLVQILTIIFCLGIFLIPKDNFYAQASQETCCKKESKSDDCCKNHHTSSKEHHSKDKESKSSCNDDCCTLCVSCAPFLEITPSKSLLSLDLSNFNLTQNLQFQYSDPYVSDGLKDIWQPPKLG
ncbi:hypothetical protein [Chryseobacterium polytrichastri]|uniref:Uncharacterized protein n=1 Tax=Chryseobacterium polytrichastri TaxID=1302687 RepID=A0A1M6WXA0_9FLAO|nr:hypothetical protein [Chryseobacterium polytrichastri]SHK98165.1 hypothetical protein SAMN05444267_101021 [Chryseobacterium polytrichastri]